MSTYKMFDPYSYLRSGGGDSVEVQPSAEAVRSPQSAALATLAALAPRQDKADSQADHDPWGTDEAVASPAKAANAANMPNADNDADQGAIDAAGRIIVERDDFDPEVWAEGIARLDSEKAPADVPSARWRLFIDDAWRFLDSPFCVQAVALGWEPLDLFGCNRDRPYARIDQLGLLWLLKGNRIVALTAMTGVIEMTTGARQTYHRKPREAGRILAWRLETNPPRSNIRQGDLR